MQYNYYYEIASVLFLGLLFFVLLIQSNFELAKGRAFFTLIISCIVESIMNVISAWGLDHTEFVSSTANWWLCFLFFVAEACTSVLFFRYVVTLCETSRAKRTYYAKMALVPFVIFIFMILTTRSFHLIFDVQDNVYTQGIAAWYGYFYITLYITASLVVAITAKSTIRGRNRYAVVIASLISAAAIIVQYQVKWLILTGISNAIIIYIFYILIQNPNELKDKTANVSNGRAFALWFENMQNQERNMQILTVDIHQQNQLDTIFGYRNSTLIISEVGEYLTELTKQKKVFHISANVFAIALSDSKDADQIRKKILERFDQPWALDSVNTMVTVNLGRLRVPEDAATINEFYGVHNFMKQLIRKDMFHNFIEMTPELREQYERTSRVNKALNRALRDQSLQVYFQPIYNIKKGKFTSLEALARMFDPELGFVAPDEFIAAAEQNGTIVPLDLMILEKTCAFIEDEILPRNDLLEIDTVQVNISVLQCLQQNMDEMVLSIIDKYHVPHEMIMLEITERASITIAELMEKHMRSLKAQGIRFALDDYGTGNSNCSYLIEYPFDKVKFDKTMIWAYFKAEKARIVLDGEMRTLHKLHIPIVAEGIEEEDQYQTMVDLGVEQIQGYYFSQPLSQLDALVFLEERNADGAETI